MCAYDTHLTYANNDIDDIDHHFNEDLAKVSEWLIANRLTLNQSKAELILIGSRQRISTFNSSPSLTINDVPIKQVSHTKSLVVHIDIVNRGEGLEAGGVAKLCYCSLSRDNTGASKSI
jgi:hypothetical protein